MPEFVLPFAGILLVADLALGARMSFWYCTHGPILALVRRTARPGPLDPPSLSQLQGRFRTAFMPALLFSDFGGTSYGFRWSLLVGSGLLHRTVEFDRTTRSVVVRGRLGLFCVPFLALAIAGAGTSRIFVVGVVAALTLIDYLGCRWVASAAITLWSQAPRAAA